MPEPEIQCRFCERTFSRSQSLASHIRIGHSKQYPKWLKTPNRHADAQKSTVAPEPSPKPSEPAGLPQAAPDVGAQASASAIVEANPTLELLKTAHAQLIGRKQNI